MSNTKSLYIAHNMHIYLIRVLKHIISYAVATEPSRRFRSLGIAEPSKLLTVP